MSHEPKYLTRGRLHLVLLFLALSSAGCVGAGPSSDPLGDELGSVTPEGSNDQPVAFGVSGSQSLVALCQYDIGYANHFTTSACDPAEQLDHQVYGRNFVWKMGYVMRPDVPQAPGTSPLCTAYHATYGLMTSSLCGEAALRNYGPGWVPTHGDLGVIGWVYSNTLAQPSGTVTLCQYRHSSGRFLTTTQCDQASVENAARYGYSLVGPLGYVFPPGVPPVGDDLGVVRPNAADTTRIFQSMERDRSLNAQVFAAYPSELPPLVANLPGQPRVYILPTNSTWRCDSDRNYLERPLALRRDECQLVSRSSMLESIGAEGQLRFRRSLPNDLSEYWGRNYNGLFSVHVVGEGDSRRLIGVTHGEHQNWSVDGVRRPTCGYGDDKCLASVVRPSTSQRTAGVLDPCMAQAAESRSCDAIERCYWNTTDDECRSINPVDYQAFDNSWRTFASFVSVRHLAAPTGRVLELDRAPGRAPGLSDERWTDMGPAVWPDTSYAVDGGGVGPYHPTSFVHDGHMYIYYSRSRRLGRPGICISAARAELNAEGVPGPFYAFRTNGDGGHFPDVSLPSNFTPSGDLFSAAGSTSDCLTEEPGPFGTWFSVAELTGTGKFISAEWRIVKSGRYAEHEEIVIRVSDTPYSWREAKTFVLDRAPPTYGPNGEIVAGSWGGTAFNYPTFVNAEGTDNYHVDANDFFIIGNNPRGNRSHRGAYQLFARRLCAQVPGVRCP